MKKTTKTAGQTAQENKTNTKAVANKESKAIAKAEREATRKAQQEATAREARATKVAGRIKAENETLSGVLRSVWLYVEETPTDADNIRKADALAIREDFRAVTGEEWPSTRREFARLWLEAIRKYCKAVSDKGEALSIKTSAGYSWGVPYRPTLAKVWAEVVGGWAKRRTPAVFLSGCYYKAKTTGKVKGFEKAPTSEAERAIAEAERVAKAVAEAKAKAGEEARKALGVAK